METKTKEKSKGKNEILKKIKEKIKQKKEKAEEKKEETPKEETPKVDVDNLLAEASEDIEKENQEELKAIEQEIQEESPKVDVDALLAEAPKTEEDLKKEIINKIGQESLENAATLLEETPKEEPTNNETEVKRKTGIKAQLERLTERLDEMGDLKKKKGKQWKLKGNVKSKLKGLVTKDEILICILKGNAGAEIKVYKIVNGMVKINDLIYHVSHLHIFLMDGKFPFAVIPQWKLSALGTKQYYTGLTEKDEKAYDQSLIIRHMENAEAGIPKKLGGKQLIWWIVGGITVFYILFAGQGGA